MVDQNLIANLGIEEQEAEQMLAEAFGDDVAEGNLDSLLEGQIGDFKPGSILQGKIIGKAGDDFLVEVGLKSEGILDKNEFDEPESVEVGDTVEVLLEQVEGEAGTVQISKRKADRIRCSEHNITP
ncbi:MAG: S1 RNA-binding domain-containing protein, partial [Phycisphaeraceae bacterium]